MGEQEARAEVRRIAEAARAASGALGQTTRAERDGALRAMAAALRAHAGDIVAANEVDMEAARAEALRMRDDILSVL